MKRIYPVLTLLFIIGVISGQATAAPTLSVVRRGKTNDDHLRWEIFVVPDKQLLNSAETGLRGAVAVELNFTTTAGGKITTALAESSRWPYANPGNNPYSRSTTSGVWTELSTGRVFVSLGSDLVTDDGPIPVLTLFTSGTAPTVLTWGEETALSGTQLAYATSRIAQNGQNFDGISGSLKAHLGNLDDDNDVDSSDLLAFLSNWTGALETPNPQISFSHGDWDGDYDVDSSDLLVFLESWTGAAASRPEPVGVPEPSASLMLCLGCFWAAIRHRHPSVRPSVLG